MFTNKSSLKLSNFTDSRNNNFNLIRIVAAYCVLITHSFVITMGTGDSQPFRHALGMSIGSISVDVFFLTSGFLVTASLLKRKNIIEFVWARILRIFPALFVMLTLTVFISGMFLTSLPKVSFFTNSKTYEYLIKSFTLINDIGYTLPGVFCSNPYKNFVNGSLWSMPYELKMYIILAGIWVLSKNFSIIRSKLFDTLVILIVLFAGISDFLYHFIMHIDKNWARLVFMFFTGSVFFIFKDKIILSRIVFITFLILLIIATRNPVAFFIVYNLTLAYILFFIAFIPSGFVRYYNKFGDYSYGIYIYAFPVQQSIIFFIPRVSVLTMIIFSTIITFVFAFLSWHLIEKHALRLKDHFIIHTKLLLGVR